MVALRSFALPTATHPCTPTLLYSYSESLRRGKLSQDYFFPISHYYFSVAKRSLDCKYFCMDISATLHCMCITKLQDYISLQQFTAVHPHSLPMVSCICKCYLGIAGMYMDYIMRRDIEIYDHISRSCTGTIYCAAILKYTIIYRAVARLDSSINLFYLFIPVLTFTFFLLVSIFYFY